MLLKCTLINFICSKKLSFLALELILSCLSVKAMADDSVAHYMANEALMVVHGDTKIMFDPIYKNSYNNYMLLPEEMQAALFAGEAPYDGLDAIFISHYHGDHFTPEDVLRFMNARPNVELYAPSQAVMALRTIATDADQKIFNRITFVDLEYKDVPVTLIVDNLMIEAVRIPHSGWPTGRLDIANIVWRVTLDDATTVIHLGDADANDVHFATDSEFWSNNQPDMAFPPYWFYSSQSGLDILSGRIAAQQSVGIHVPTAMSNNPSARPVQLRNVDLFTIPGETRTISGH
ncbi:MAG: L-ascorbate metabolism protein UlaG (beta-lactamase superfamily) [Pseudohongiellaceae bacterium]|jgi:L-ascorbate metabolism protein UlaG (beta-lactamase superfamily)